MSRLIDRRAAVLDLLGADPASRHLGIRVASVDDDAIVVSLPTQDWMRNGHGILHGAALFWVGDTAFALLMEATGMPSVSRQADIAYIAPVPVPTRLLATATEKARFGRNSIVDVDIEDASGALVARMTVYGAALRKARED